MGDLELAITFLIASQAALVGGALLLAYGLVAVWRRYEIHEAFERGLFEAFLAIFFFMAFRTTYYIAARAIPEDELDLFHLHPVPEILSALMALSLYAAAIPCLCTVYRASARIVAPLCALVAAMVWVCVFGVLNA